MYHGDGLTTLGSGPTLVTHTTLGSEAGKFDGIGRIIGCDRFGGGRGVNVMLAGVGCEPSRGVTGQNVFDLGIGNETD